MKFKFSKISSTRKKLKIGHLATMAFSPVSCHHLFFPILVLIWYVWESAFISQISHHQYILLLLPFFFLMCFTIWVSSSWVAQRDGCCGQTWYSREWGWRIRVEEIKVKKETEKETHIVLVNVGCCDVAVTQINYPNFKHNTQDSIEQARGRSHEQDSSQIFMLDNMQFGGDLDVI